MHRSILSLSKISHEMWHDHPAKEKGQQKEQWEWGFSVTGKCPPPPSHSTKNFPSCPPLQSFFKNLIYHQPLWMEGREGAGGSDYDSLYHLPCNYHQTSWMLFLFRTDSRGFKWRYYIRNVCACWVWCCVTYIACNFPNIGEAEQIVNMGFEVKGYNNWSLPNSVF